MGQPGSVGAVVKGVQERELLPVGVSLWIGTGYSVLLCFVIG